MVENSSTRMPYDGYFKVNWKTSKDSKKSKVLMTDIELSKKITVDAITLMENGPYSGGMKKNCWIYM